jgi:hypothetical protein
MITKQSCVITIHTTWTSLTLILVPISSGFTKTLTPNCIKSIHTFGARSLIATHFTILNA